MVPWLILSKREPGHLQFGIPVMKNNPILHFFLIGGLLYSVSYWAQSFQGDFTGQVLVINKNLMEGAVNKTLDSFVGVAEAEVRRHTLDQAVQDEVLFREALKFNFHLGDEIVRRQMIRKMDLIIESRSNPAQPTEADLLQWWKKNKIQYTEPRQYTFYHVFSDKSAAELERLAREYDQVFSEKPEKAYKYGDAFYPGNQFLGLSYDEIQVRVGASAAAAIAKLKLKQWSEPIASVYGYHLFYLDTLTAAGELPFDSVKEKVYQDLMAKRLGEEKQKQLKAMVDQYRVIYE